MSTSDKTTNYDQLVDELKEQLIGDEFRQSNVVSNSAGLISGADVSKLQRNILAATKELPQASPASILRGMSQQEQQSGNQRPSFLSRLGGLLGVRQPVAMWVAVAGLVLIVFQVGWYPSLSEKAVTSVLVGSEADLTFEELWLNEDALLFSGEI